MSGTWQPVSNQPPFNASTMLLLTDGTIMCQESGNLNWWKLQPDSYGNYLQGTWSSLAPMHHTRLYYASAVLDDGRVFVAGGEYSDAGSETNTAEIYDPLLDTWTEIASPPGWARIGDAPCCVLPNGSILIGSIDDTRTAMYDPSTNTWSAAGAKDDASSEETWTLLPDETVLTVECQKHPNAEKYLAAADTWVSAGSLPTDLVEPSSIEIGPAFLLPDGRVFAVGATPHTAVYSPPPIANMPGVWVAGPDFPTDENGNNLGAKDAPGCLLPNGKVLCAVGPVTGVSGAYLGPTMFFEFDPSPLTLERTSDPPNANGVPFTGRMMILPTGEVLFAAGTPAIYAYTADGDPDPAWRPYITDCPPRLRQLSVFKLEGRQLNGLSQAVG
ncbi:MAG TPA: kelch repeat-containing protein [Nitrospira sp.]|nr:kelch repeat-containing protein [Nitrospira sp.]